ncbi:MAG: hypothetical protein HY741_14925 [Chloroflexi bacterium]|nr:hypothetical protein [Chloroflexota bacterium]
MRRVDPRPQVFGDEGDENTSHIANDVAYRVAPRGENTWGLAPPFTPTDITTPTPTPTATPSFTPTDTPTATVTYPPTPTPTAPNTATATPTAAPAKVKVKGEGKIPSTASGKKATFHLEAKRKKAVSPLRI